MRKLERKPTAWKAVSSTTKPAPTQVGLSEGTMVLAKAPAASASIATGAEKPTSSEAQPPR